MESSDSSTPACDQLGIELSSKDRFLYTLQNVTSEALTNQVVYEIFMQMPKKRRKSDLIITWNELKTALGVVYGRDLSSMPDPYIRSAFELVKQERGRLLSRRKPSVFLEYLARPWRLPANVGVKRKAIPDSLPEPPSKETKFDVFSGQVEKETLQTLAKENNRFAARIAVLEKANKKLEMENQKLANENCSLKKRIKAWNPKRMNQTLKRKNKSLTSWISKYRAAKSDSGNSKLKKKNDELHAVLKRLKMSKHKQVQRFKAKHQSTQPEYKSLATNMSDHLNEKAKEVNAVQQEVRYWQNEALKAMEALEEEASQVLQTKIDGKSYTPEIREASYHMQDLGVAQKNVSKILQLVLKSLTGKEVSGPLPSYATQNNLSKEMKSVSRQQVVDALKDKINLTLKYDGTTKKVGHLVEIEVETEGQSLLLSLRQQGGGTADEYATSIKEGIAAVEQSGKSADVNIMSAVANTMTDRCKTNDAVDRKLEEQLGRKLNQFRCAMHPLDGMAKECEKVIKSFEHSQNINDLQKGDKYPFTHRGESNTQATVRCTAKLFFDLQFNCDEKLVSYLKSKGAAPAEMSNRSVVYHRFVGNRFHIYFLNSGLLYHYNAAIQEFFASVCPPENAVQQSVINALKINVLHTTTRALGIIGKVVTGPWMRLVGSNKNILDMNEYYAEAKEKLQSWSEDATQLIRPNLPSLFHGVAIKDDVVLDSLLKVTANNNETVKLLQDLCGACLLVIERQLQSQLPGGSFWEPGEILKEQARFCSATNISGERNFAIADQALYRAKNATPGHIESKVMFRANKTGNWLADMEEGAKKDCIQYAIRDARKISAEEKERKVQLQKAAQEKLRLSRQKLQAKEDSHREKIEQWFELAYKHGGVWLTREDLENNICNLSKTKTMAVLKAQINIRAKILKCVLGVEDKIIFTKATKEQLTSHLEKLLDADIPPEVEDLFEIIRAPLSLVGLSCVQQWMEDDQRTWWEGQILEFLPSTNEFKIKYDREETLYYLTHDELIADIIRGDLELHQH